uniref:DUF228 domain-containing protein n=1 Tax=Borrelia persica TaxID=44448 RepID=UPI0004657106
MSSKIQQAGLISNEHSESLDHEISSPLIDSDDLSEELDSEVQRQEASTRGKRRGKRHAPVLETTEGKTLKDYILKLKKYSKSFDDEPAVFKAQTGFRNKNLLTFDSICESISSSKDKLEEYPAFGFPYKRAVKLKVSTEKPDDIFVEV